MGRVVEKAWNWVLVAIVVCFALRDMAGPWGVVAAIAAAALAPFVLGPVLTHETHWISLEPGLIPFNPDGPESPEVLRSHFTQTAVELGRFGFKPRRFYRTKQATTNADGSVLLAVGYPPRKPPYFGRAFPQVDEIGYLLTVHRARVENLASGRYPVDPVGDDPDGYIRRVDFEIPFAHHVACGYNYVDEMARVQRMTWKGAILATWKLLPPVKQIRLAWERLMADWQLGNLKAGRPVS